MFPESHRSAIRYILHLRSFRKHGIHLAPIISTLELQSSIWTPGKESPGHPAALYIQLPTEYFPLAVQWVSRNYYGQNRTLISQAHKPISLSVFHISLHVTIIYQIGRDQNIVIFDFSLPFPCSSPNPTANQCFSIQSLVVKKSSLDTVFLRAIENHRSQYFDELAIVTR